MARYEKTGINEDAAAKADALVRATVEQIIADIRKRGDDAVRDWSRKFDNGGPTNFKLSEAEILAAYDTLKDVDVETLPGVVLGTQSITAAAHQRECALHRRAMGWQIHQNMHLSAHVDR
jgi:sulfopropanediol 3-dehydrogenase